MAQRTWHRIGASYRELALHNTLANGQCFGWSRRGDGSWTGALGRSVVALRQSTDQEAEFCCLHGADDADRARERLADYFQLSTPLVPLYSAWARSSPGMATVVRCLPGMRVLRQDPVECLFSFICSSNNNIARITQILTRIRERYGQLLHVDDMEEEDGTRRRYYSFPTVDELSVATDAELRALGLGYRAPFIVKTTTMLRAKEGGGEAWLRALRARPRTPEERDAVQEELIAFPGVGRKVADCVALFALDRTDCIPVDTHVWQIAVRDFDRGLEGSKSLTPTVYRRVGELFREGVGGDHAGWAHSVLFAAELPLFRALLPVETQRHMKDFAEAERARKARIKADRRAAKEAAGVPETPSPPPPAKSPVTAGSPSRSARRKVRKRAPDVASNEAAAPEPLPGTDKPKRRRRQATRRG